jgi:hypothetical protein
MHKLWMPGAAAAALLTMAGAGRAQSEAGVLPGMPVRSGVVVIKVADYEAARQQALRFALEQGAQLFDARTRVDEKGRKHGWLRLRLAADRLPRLLPAVRGVGTLYSESIATEDRGSEYEELERRVGRLRDHERRLDGLLGSARRLRGSDILFIQERLFRAALDEGMLLQRRVDLERAARAGTLTVELFEPGARPALERSGKVDLGRWFLGGLGRASEALNRLLARSATAGAYALVFTPLWLPPLLITVLLLRWLWRRRHVAAEWLRSLRKQPLTE